MPKPSAKALDLMACLGASLLMVGPAGCDGDRYQQRTRREPGQELTAPRVENQNTDQRIEDSRTAERVREALAAGPDYKYGEVQVIAGTGVVQLSGFVSTSAQRNTAAAVASKVVGVTRVENNLQLKP
jgi:osmotically-inducible protein OsmY